MKDKKSKKRVPERSIWKRRIDFFMNWLGMAIGLGNVWRFPYLCYKNGGGAFLIAYLSLIVLFVVPVIILELTLGQYTRLSAVAVWKIVPVMKGVGFSALLTLTLSDVCYPVVMAWALRWLVAGFSAGMPWVHCNNTWNEETCISLLPKATSQKNSSYVVSQVTKASDNVTNNGLSSVEEFWRNYIIGLTSGIEDIGAMKWDLALCLLTIWLMTYFSIWKGIGWTSKVVYVTSTLPLALIVVVLVRGVTLEGASKGISHYLTPDMTKLASLEIWADAANQVTFSFAIGYGCLITLSSHNKFDQNLIRDTLLVCSANAAASFVSGFAIFSVLGHLAEVKNTTVSEVAASGPGLAFIAYPTALSHLPWPNFWIILFFAIIILLGFDSLFVIQDGILECLKDLMPSLFHHKWNHEIGHAIISSIFFLAALCMMTEGGMYIFHIINSYTIAGWCVHFIIFCEAISVAWIYGAKKTCDNMQEMVPWRVPRLWLTVCWKFISPVIALVLVLYALLQTKPITYNKTTVYPDWANTFAWMSALSTVVFIPCTAVYVIWKSQGRTLWEKIRNSAKASGSIRRETENATPGPEEPFIEMS